MHQPKSKVPGGVILGGMVTGISALLLALGAAFGMEWISAGLALMAAALVFGLLANAIYRQ